MKIFLREFAENQFGYDIKIENGNETLGEYTDALNSFQDNTMVACRGCDGCCYERIPLTIADFALAKPLIAKIMGKPEQEITLVDWLQDVAEIHTEENGSIDITLKRNDDLSCFFLNKEKQECTRHLYRTLVCQTHCCLPKSDIAIDIRGDIINAGEDELCRQLLLLPDHPWKELLSHCKTEDFSSNGFSDFAPEDWRSIPLKSIISDQNWQILTDENL